ncbi:alpha/beta hydrolase [Pseudonocardia sp. NPDC049154]|uniref:alpha/beta fold hydrolase n=1 Tax=Pseudonocardia sp. NPDC049154 TaxID=3155501 RepID=UPI0033F0C78D
MSVVELGSGIRLAYDDVGSGGPAIVFSHGLFMDREMFAPQVKALAADHRCVVWDERGHGETRSSGPFDFWDSARDLLALLDHLGLDRVVHVGMSQGGLLGQRAAVLAPERFSGLVFLDSQAGTLAGDGAARFTRLAEDWVEHGADEETLAYVAGIILGPGVDHEAWKARWRKADPVGYREAVRTLVAREDFTPRLGEIVPPVLVIHGSADVSTPLERARAVAEGVPDCRGLVVIDGAPHAANLSHPAEVTAAIRDFVDGLGPR